MRIFSVFALVIFLSACGTAHADPYVSAAGNKNANTEVTIEVPESYKIEKKTDLSAGVASMLFGTAFNDILGTPDIIYSITGKKLGEGAQLTVAQSNADVNKRGGVGIYAGLITSVLGVLNLAAMAFVATAIIYMWAIFAVTTAHEGNKFGGSIYNSLWVPVRHACSFSLTVPVVSGLSLMQVGIVVCVGLSINFANRIWDASGEYILQHVHTGIIDSSSPMIETDAYKLIPLMFESSVIQAVELSRDQKMVSNAEKTGKLHNFSLNGIDTQIVPLGTIPETYENNGDEESHTAYLKVTKNYREGFATISAVPPNKILANVFGSVRFPLPKKYCYPGNIATDVELGSGAASHTDGGVTCSAWLDKDTQARFELQDKIANARINDTVKLWQEIWGVGIRYLSSKSAAKDTCVFPTCEPALFANEGTNPVNVQVLEYVRQYATNVTKDTEQNVRKLLNDFGVTTSNGGKATFKEVLRKAIDNDGKKSSFGWMSAGSFYFTYASIQKMIDEQVLGQIDVIYPPVSDDQKRANVNGGWWDRVTSPTIRLDKVLNDAQGAAIRNLDNFTANVVLGSERYSPMAQAGTETTLLHKIAAAVVNKFITSKSSQVSSTSNRTSSILGTVLDEFGTYDPIIVMSNFGNRLLDVVPQFVALSVATSLILDTCLGIGLLVVIIMAGAMFAYVVPITPLIFWLKALLSWIYMVVESMVAAPFWACAHALPEGAGFAGQHARRGYMMLLDIVIRPTLLVLGAVFAIAIIQASGWFFNVLFNSWFANVTGTFVGIGLIGDIAFTIVVMSTMYYISFTVFTKGVNYLPERVLHWCGGGGSGGGLRDEENGTMAIVAAGGMYHRASHGLQGAAAAIGGGAGKAKGKLAGAIQSAAKKKNDDSMGEIAPAAS